MKPDGSVEVEISRKEEIEVDGIEVPPSFGTELIVFFEPIGNGQAAIQGEFALIQSEVSDTVEKMRENGIEITALHHHETDLDPQLLHLHTFATGDEADLAQRVNRGLKHVNRER